jgi:hypothetical protein
LALDYVIFSRQKSFEGDHPKPREAANINATQEEIMATPAPAQPTTTTDWAPTAKVSAGVLASAVTILIFQFVPEANKWTPAVAASITQIVTFVVQYWVPDRKK